MKNITDKEKMLEYSWRFQKSFPSSPESEEEGWDVSTQNDKSSPKFGSKLRIRFEDGIPGVRSPLKFIPKIVVF